MTKNAQIGVRLISALIANRGITLFVAAILICTTGAFFLSDSKTRILAGFFSEAPSDMVCDGIWQQSLKEGNSLILALEHQLPFTSDPYTVFEHFKRGAWHVVWSDSDISEPGAIFILSDGADMQIVTGWGGVALESEGEEIERHLLSLNETIPGDLLHCFSWYVTRGRYLDAPTWPNPFNNYGIHNASRR